MYITSDDSDTSRNLKGWNVDPSFFVAVIDDADVSGSAHDNGTLAMNFIGHELRHPTDLTLKVSRGGDSSCLFDDERHRNALVQTAELSLRTLLVGGVDVNASVEQRPVNICNHGTCDR